MDWNESIPKVELHVHLEGAIPQDALWELIEKYGGDPLAPNLATLRKRFQYRDFPHFIEVWSWQNRFLREYEDFSFIAEAVARDLSRQNHRYVEMMFSPSLFKSRGMVTQLIAEAVRRGLTRVPGLRVALIADLVRDYGPEREFRTLAELSETKEMGVFGIGIGGSEQDYPPQPFAELFSKARDLGFHTMAHAGEASGSESVWGAIRALKVERIGHGARAVEDPVLMDYLLEHQLPIDMCPLSNARTGVVPSIAAHPIRQFYEMGLTVTVNTDDPKMFGTSLAKEFSTLEKELGFEKRDIMKLTRNAVKASWLPEDEKLRLEKGLLADPAWGFV